MLRIRSNSGPSHLGWIPLAVALLLSACASPTPLKPSMNGEGRPNNEVGIVRGGTTTGDFLAYLAGAKRLPASTENDRQSFVLVHPGELRLLPGTYLLTVHCEAKGGWAYPTLRVEMQAGQTYLVVSSSKTITHQASPRSNLFHRNTTGEALISAIPLRMRSLSSSLDLTRM